VPKKKRKGKDKDLNQQMLEAEAVTSRDERKRLQTDTLKSLFITYFRILKKGSHNAAVLLAVLKGLAKFSHLVNVEIVADLITCLKEIMLKDQSSSDFALHIQLQCMITTFQALKHQKDSIDMDLQDFYVHLYSILPNICNDTSSSSIPYVLQCIQLMIVDKKQVSNERVCAFIKKLTTLSLSVPPNAAIAFIHIAHQLFQRYPRAQQLLDNETTGSGVYMAELPDPEHCNAIAAKLFELAILKGHYHPFLAKYATDLVSGTLFSNLTLSAAYLKHTPMELFRTYDGELNPIQKPVIPKAEKKHMKHPPTSLFLASLLSVTQKNSTQETF